MRNIQCNCNGFGFFAKQSTNRELQCYLSCAHQAMLKTFYQSIHTLPSPNTFSKKRKICSRSILQECLETGRQLIAFF